MRNSERSREGYLFIDHRASPGVPDGLLRNLGINGPSVAEGEVFEAPTLSCTHCGGCWIINPDRKRARHKCSSCDHYICDACAAQMQLDGRCVTYFERAMGVLRETLVAVPRGMPK